MTSRFSWASIWLDLKALFTIRNLVFGRKKSISSANSQNVSLVSLCDSFDAFTAFFLFNQSNHLAFSKKDCDWLIQACLKRVHNECDNDTFVRLEKTVCFGN